MNDEKIPEYKPLKKGSKFKKPNAWGQVPHECLNFTFQKKHCWNGFIDYDLEATDCKVLKGEFCENYVESRKRG